MEKDTRVGTVYVSRRLTRHYLSGWATLTLMAFGSAGAALLLVGGWVQ